ncbi:MAG: DUF2474 domain-containing protein [Euryhalocaulis sp.]|nr:hypothetical protein [Euryhalocaulis sp.]MBA4801555.1 DUF2474 domain-containing protein [Euryhalocaulis sp.]
MATTDPEETPGGPARKALWFVGLWIAGFAVVVGGAYALKLIMGMVVGL